MHERPPARRDAGISLVEIMMALVVLSTALLAMVSLMFSSQKVQQDARERSVAFNAARQKIEELRGTAFAEVYPRYNASKADDLSGSNPGATFSVSGLPPRADGAPQGEIVFPEAGGTLQESLDDKLLSVSLGLPKDLNRDGDASDAGLSAGEVRLLPVLVRIRWGKHGRREVSLETSALLGSRETD